MVDLILEEQKAKEESPMWSYLQQEEYDYKQPKRGDIISEGVVLSKSSEEILVDVGLKLEAIVPRRDLEKLEPEYLGSIKVGDTVPVFVLQPEDQEGRLVVSLNMARTLKDWNKAQEMLESGELYETTVTNFNKGGVIVPFFGLRGFVPASQLVTLPKRTEGGQRIDRLSEMVDKTLRLKIIEVNRRRRRLIMSERAAMREWRREQKERLLQSLKAGDKCRGVVTNLMNFGAFVDLGGADGLVHVSEISWHRVRHPRDVLHVGQEVEVEVLNVDQEHERIALSIKKLQPDPWTLADEHYNRGDLIEAEITNVMDFGAFARLPEGIEGLIHISELAEGPVEDAHKIVKKGDRLTLRVINMDVARKRIGLSLKQAKVDEEEIEEIETEIEIELEAEAEAVTEAVTEAEAEIEAEAEAEVEAVVEAVAEVEAEIEAEAEAEVEAAAEAVAEAVTEVEAEIEAEAEAEVEAVAEAAAEAVAEVEAEIEAEAEVTVSSAEGLEVPPVEMVADAEVILAEVEPVSEETVFTEELVGPESDAAPEPFTEEPGLQPEAEALVTDEENEPQPVESNDAEENLVAEAVDQPEVSLDPVEANPVEASTDLES